MMNEHECCKRFLRSKSSFARIRFLRFCCLPPRPLHFWDPFSVPWMTFLLDLGALGPALCSTSPYASQSAFEQESQCVCFCRPGLHIMLAPPAAESLSLLYPPPQSASDQASQKNASTTCFSCPSSFSIRRGGRLTRMGMASVYPDSSPSSAYPPDAPPPSHHTHNTHVPAPLTHPLHPIIGAVSLVRVLPSPPSPFLRLHRTLD